MSTLPNFMMVRNAKYGIGKRQDSFALHLVYVRCPTISVLSRCIGRSPMRNSMVQRYVVLTLRTSFALPSLDKWIEHIFMRNGYSGILYGSQLLFLKSRDWLNNSQLHRKLVSRSMELTKPSVCWLARINVTLNKLTHDPQSRVVHLPMQDLQVHR